jgi:hypothetical protein
MPANPLPSGKARSACKPSRNAAVNLRFDRAPTHLTSFLFVMSAGVQTTATKVWDVSRYDHVLDERYPVIVDLPSNGGGVNGKQAGQAAMADVLSDLPLPYRPHDVIFGRCDVARDCTSKI